MGKFSLSSITYKLSEESAKAQIMSFLEYYGKDPDEGDKDKQKATEQMLNKLLKAIRQGFVEIKSDMTIVQKLQAATGTATDITYKKLTGKDILAMEDEDESKFRLRIHVLLARLSGLDTTTFSSLSPIDLATAEVIGVLFLL